MQNKFIELLPESLQKNKDVIKLSGIIDNHLKNIDNIIDKLTIYASLENNKLDEQYVDALAYTFHLLANESYRFANTVERKRELVRSALILHKTKGTKYAVERVCNILELKQAKIIEWFKDNSEPYTFKINANAFDGLNQETIRLLYVMVGEFKNVRSHISVFEFNMSASGCMYIAGAYVCHQEIAVRQYYNDNNKLDLKMGIAAGQYEDSVITIKEKI